MLPSIAVCPARRPPIHSQPRRVWLRRQRPGRNKPHQLVDTSAGSLHGGEILYFGCHHAWRSPSISSTSQSSLLLSQAYFAGGCSLLALAPVTLPTLPITTRPAFTTFGTWTWMIPESLTSFVWVALSRQVGLLARMQGTGPSTTGGRALAVRCASRTEARPQPTKTHDTILGSARTCP